MEIADPQFTTGNIAVKTLPRSGCAVSAVSAKDVYDAFPTLFQHAPRWAPLLGRPESSGKVWLYRERLKTIIADSLPWNSPSDRRRGCPGLGRGCVLRGGLLVLGVVVRARWVRLWVSLFQPADKTDPTHGRPIALACASCPVRRFPPLGIRGAKPLGRTRPGLARPACRARCQHGDERLVRTQQPACRPIHLPVDHAGRLVLRRPRITPEPARAAGPDDLLRDLRRLPGDHGPGRKPGGLVGRLPAVHRLSGIQGVSRPRPRPAAQPGREWFLHGRRPGGLAPPLAAGQTRRKTGRERTGRDLSARTLCHAHAERLDGRRTGRGSRSRLGRAQGLADADSRGRIAAGKPTRGLPVGQSPFLQA